jgi:hypothetical protein
MGEKMYDSYNSTSVPSWPKLPQHAAVKSYKDNALLETILGNTNSEFSNSNNTDKNNKFENEFEVHCIYSGEKQLLYDLTLLFSTSLYSTTTMKPKSPMAMDHLPAKCKANENE